MGEETELDLQLYRQKIVMELERRLLVLQDVEKRMSSAQFVFGQASQASRAGAGSTARMQVEQAHRLKLRRALSDLEKKRIEAKVDLERAEARLKEVDLRLDELLKEREGV